MSDYQFTFEAEIEKYDFGKMYYSVVYIPGDLIAKLPFGKSKRLRIDGEIQGERFEGAIMPAKGRWYLMVSKKLQKKCGLALGSLADVQFDIADQEAIQIPTELQFALEADADIDRLWKKATTGKRRSFCHYVKSAKLPATRERRVEEVLQFLMDSK